MKAPTHHKKLRSKYQRLGLCVVCGKTREPGFKVCPACRSRAQKRREKLRGLNLCGVCGKPCASKSKSRCPKCLVLASKRTSDFRAKGLCYCGKRPPNPNGAQCQQCLDRKNKRNHELKACGKCQCGKPTTGDWKLCPACRKRAAQNAKVRFHSDKEYAIMVRLRDSVYGAIKKRRKHSKTGRTEFIIGCTFDFAREHLESLFLPGMSWDNMGAWHIDHYIPCCAFNLVDERQQRLCCNWRNLRPLWAVDNLIKKGKLPPDYAARMAELEKHVPHLFDQMNDPIFL